MIFVSNTDTLSHALSLSLSLTHTARGVWVEKGRRRVDGGGGGGGGGG